MNIAELSTDDLYAELDRRAQEKIESDHFLCMGLIDIDGAESLMKVKSGNKFAELHSSLSLRARFNSQRRPIFYVVNITQPMFDSYDERMKKGEYVKVGEELKALTTFKRLGY